MNDKEEPGMPIAEEIMGDVWPAVEPGRDDGDYGTVALSPCGPCEVWSLQTFTLVYTVGRFGLDDTGSIRICHLWVYDGGALQTVDPSAENYIAARLKSERAGPGVELGLCVEPFGARPWDVVLRVTVRNGVLREGDEIAVVYGDRTGGSPGFRMPSYCESSFEFRVAVDACATGQFRPLPERPAVSVVPGPAVRWKLTAPTARRPDEPFALGVKAEDVWGNPAGPGSGARRRFFLRADCAVAGLPESVEWRGRGRRLSGLSIARPGIWRIALFDAEGETLAVSNPVVIGEMTAGSFWGDLHGQSGETVGVNAIDEYFTFARDLGFLDVAAHQGNDFQINEAFWREINAAAARFNEDGAFVVFPGYEWSGNTAVGGDHNVFFRREGRRIRRSSHAMIADRSDIASDANTSAALFEALAGEDCVLYAHVGGRPADVAFAHSPELRTAVEVHSDWGTFEWLMTDSLALGHRVGLVCNSDGHKGRPGASHPGASSFGAYGGLTCFRAESLTRDGVFEAMRRRHHYGTTGARMHLEVCARFARETRLFIRDPRFFDVEPRLVREAAMGDIVETDAPQVDLALTVAAGSPIERIDVLNGAETVRTLRCYGADDLGARVRLYWEGAEHRGRGRQTAWRGTARVAGARVTAMERINAWNPARRIELEDAPEGGALVRFDAITTGNFGGVDLRLDRIEGATVDLRTQHVSGAADLSALGLEDRCFEAGGLERRLRLRRLPENPTQTELSRTVQIPLAGGGDNPIWVRVTTADGHVAWSSPIFLCRDAAGKGAEPVPTVP